uniref:Uncharacterized protein n=1 Tax=Arundo donax TaxID=35708 RepID=A0A0A9FUM0_ARUDO
MMILMLYALW